MARATINPDAKDRRLAETLARYGLSDSEIAAELTIDHRTLRKHYAADLDHGRLRAHANATVALYRKIQRGNVRAILFHLRHRMGWRAA
jgi:predicted transcriptional regulator